MRMESVTKKIGDRGEIVLPKKLRQHFGMQKDDEVEIIATSSGILIVPLVKDLKKLAGICGTGGMGDEKELDATIDALFAGTG